jgi:hypothetical protein
VNRLRPAKLLFRRTPVTTILLVDNDLGFMAYLRMAITEAGYIAGPATIATGTRHMLRELGLAHVDPLVVNLALAGPAGLVESLRSRHARVLSIENTGVTPKQPVPVDGRLSRPSEYSQSMSSDWWRTVSRVLGKPHRNG